MLFTFLLVIHAIIAAALVGVILVQRSEGGGLGMGGSPSGLMSARGAADFLTRATTVLASIFVVMSIVLAALASVAHGPQTIDTSLARPASTTGQTPTSDVPIAGAPAAPLPGLGNASAPALEAVPIAPVVGAPATTGAARPAVRERESARERTSPAAASTGTGTPATRAEPAARRATGGGATTGAGAPAPAASTSTGSTPAATTPPSATNSPTSNVPTGNGAGPNR